MIQDFMGKCVGRWHSILTQHGIDAKFLRNAHGPCPVCGGSDRFRWDNKNDNGTFYCSNCGAGDGLKLLKLFTGRSIHDLVRAIDPPAHKAVDGKKKSNADNAAKRIRNLLAESKPLSGFKGGVVRKYLHERGVRASGFLREHPALKYYDENGKVIAEYPAMIAVIGDGQAVKSLHVTYLTPEGKKAPVPSPKKIITPVASMDGACIRLTKVYETIGIAEGIETALAVTKVFSVPCWASATAGMMEKFAWPPEVKFLRIFGDQDDSFTGHKAAYTLAVRARKAGLQVTVDFPRDDVNDYADVAEMLK